MRFGITSIFGFIVEAAALFALPPSDAPVQSGPGAKAPPPRAKEVECCGLKSDAAKHRRGYKTPKADVLKRRHVEALKRHGYRVRNLPKATPAAFDCRQMGWVPGVQDQGQCGSCWDVSTTGVLTAVYVKAGLKPGDGSFWLSPQYVLDCGQNGGCNGDDAPTVLEMARTGGIPSSADYGPYIARPQRCRYSNQTLYKIRDWGFCTPSQQMGVADTQDIKNCLVQYGPLSSAVVANSSWDDYQGGVLPFERSSPNEIDHDVSIIGWDDTKQAPGSSIRGAWLVLNQWGKSWGQDGCLWIGYGSHQIGTEAAWATVTSLPPPPPGPTPTPPGPAPTPTPPTPGPSGNQVVIDADAHTVTLPPGWTVKGNTAPTLQAELAAAGVKASVAADIVALYANVKAKASIATVAADFAKLIGDMSAP